LKNLLLVGVDVREHSQLFEGLKTQVLRLVDDENRPPLDLNRNKSVEIGLTRSSHRRQAQNLGFEALEELRMLSNVNTRQAAILANYPHGQPQLKDMLRAPQNAAVCPTGVNRTSTLATADSSRGA